MKNLPPIEFPQKGISWSFMKSWRRSGSSRAGQAMRAKAGVRKIEELLREKKSKKP
jgi:hypothetical protein